jgi:peptide/nickel transport system permease protein
VIADERRYTLSASGGSAPLARLASAETGVRRSRTVWVRLRRDRVALAGLGVFMLLLGVALLAPLISPYDPNAQDLYSNLQGPSGAHLLGTDDLGRDLLSRIIYGSRVSLVAGLAAMAMALCLGVPIGATAGYFGGRYETVMMRAMDSLLALPGIILAIALMAALRPSLQNVIIALGVVAMPAYARLVRGSVLSVKERDYVEAARAMGAGHGRILAYHVMPNVMAPIIVQATLQTGTAMLSEAGLSFLGLGVQPPTASWGSILNDGRSYLYEAAYVATFPGLAIMVAVLSLNLLGDGLRDALDPRLTEG